MKMKMKIMILVAGLRRVMPKIDEHGPSQLNTRDHLVPQSNLASQQPQSQEKDLSSQAELTLATSVATRCASVACVFVA
jgi:hypothetical protein